MSSQGRSWLGGFELPLLVGLQGGERDLDVPLLLVAALHGDQLPPVPEAVDRLGGAAEPLGGFGLAEPGLGLGCHRRATLLLIGSAVP